MTVLSVGDRVSGNGIGSGTYYEGVLVAFPGPGRKSHRILVKKARELKAGSAAPGNYASVINVKKLEDNQVTYVNNLIGPKPKPVEEPKFVAPFESDGRNVVDANRKVIFRVQFGGYRVGGYRAELPMAESYELARIVAEALSEKFAKPVEDSKAPF